MGEDVGRLARAIEEIFDAVSCPYLVGQVPAIVPFDAGTVQSVITIIRSCLADVGKLYVLSHPESTAIVFIQHPLRSMIGRPFQPCPYFSNTSECNIEIHGCIEFAGRILDFLNILKPR